MSFEDINSAVRAKGGNFVNLKNVGDKVAGKIVAEPEVRDQSFKGIVITVQDGVNKGKVRKSWVFVLENSEGNTIKVECKESAQWAITAALNGRKIALNGHLQLEVVAKETMKQPEFKALYTDPQLDFPPAQEAAIPAPQAPSEDDAPPF